VLVGVGVGVAEESLSLEHPAIKIASDKAGKYFQRRLNVLMGKPLSLKNLTWHILQAFPRFEYPAFTGCIQECPKPK
jgi:hypothetical protein